MLAIRQLFADLAILVAAQGEMINNIESNIHTAKEYVFKAEKDLVKSKDNLSSARKVNHFYHHIYLNNFRKNVAYY